MMMENLAHNLSSVAPHLDPAIADPEAFRRVLALAQNLPPVTDVVLETRLNTDVSQIDLSLCMNAGDGHYEAFASGRAPYGGQRHPGWSGLRRVMIACTEPDHLLARSTSRFWLEFDVDRTPPASLLPGYYVDVHHLDLHRAYAPGYTRVSQKVALARALFELALSNPWDDAHGSFLSRCFACLPAGTVVAYLGNMLPRHETVTRFAVRGLGVERAPTYLKDLGWTHDASLLFQSVAPLRDVADQLVFNFSAEGMALTPRIDVECLPRGLATSRWQPILQRLAAAGLCTPRQAQALVQWTGVNSADLPPSPGLLGRLTPVVQRGINHLKLVFRPGQPLELKAYLVCRQLWLDSARFRPVAKEMGRDQ